MTILEKLNWIDRLPQPERNGWKGAIIMVSLLWLVLMPVPTGMQRDENPLAQVVCELMPWKCLDRGPSDSDDVREMWHQWRFVTNVHFGPPKHRKLDSLCACHEDVKSGATITHIVQEESPTCESVWQADIDFHVNNPSLPAGDLLTEWTPMCAWHYDGTLSPPVCYFVSNRGIEIVGDVHRYHCTQDEAYTVPGVTTTLEKEDTQ